MNSKFSGVTHWGHFALDLEEMSALLNLRVTWVSKEQAQKESELDPVNKEVLCYQDNSAGRREVSIYRNYSELYGMSVKDSQDGMELEFYFKPDDAGDIEKLIQSEAHNLFAGKFRQWMSDAAFYEADQAAQASWEIFHK